MSLADLLWPEKTPLSREELDRRARIIHDRLAALEAFAPDWAEEVNLLRSVGLERINNALLPAYQQIIEIANLGALLSTTSDSEVTIGNGAKTFVVPETKRLNFAPTPYLIAYADGDFDLSMIGQLSSYDSETGQLVIAVESFKGDGTFTSWNIGPVATTADLEALRDQVQANAAAAQSSDDAAAASAAAAADSAAGADTAAGAATTALTTFQEAWYGARATEPEGAELGAQYLDVSQTPNVVKVLTETGWAPTVTISIGGSRQQVYVATAGQTGPFTVDGGFSHGSVNVNGVELFHGHGVTLDAAAGTFTLDAGRHEGDVLVFRGYLANDAADIYVKAEADQRFPSVKHAQAFTAAEKGRARGNIGADVLSGFRNKIINGDFDIWQRGNSRTMTNAGAGTFIADRWRHSGNMSGTTFTVSRQEHVLGQTDVPGNPRYFLRYDRTVTGGSDTSVQQRVEGVTTFCGKTVTATIWVKGTVGKSFDLQLTQYFGTGGSPSATLIIDTVSIPMTASWVKHSVTFTPPSVAGKTLGTNNDDSLILTFQAPTAQGNMVIDLSHVSLVEGDATGEEDPFSPRHIEQELALCQRYYRTIGTGVYLWSANSTAIRFANTFTAMRALPALALLNPDPPVVLVNSSATPSGTVLSSVIASPDGARGIISGYTGLTAGQPGTFTAPNIIALDAEL